MPDSTKLFLGLLLLLWGVLKLMDHLIPPSPPDS